MNLLKTPLFILLFMLLSLDAISQDVAQFRGINRDGIYDGSNLLESWPEAGPALKWANEKVGGGFSAPYTYIGTAFFESPESDNIARLLIKMNMLLKYFFHIIMKLH